MKSLVFFYISKQSFCLVCFQILLDHCMFSFLILYSFCEILTLVGVFSLFFQSSIILTHDILTHNNKIVSSINMFSFLRKINQTCDVTTVSGLVLYWKSLLLKYPFHVGWTGVLMS